MKRGSEMLHDDDAPRAKKGPRNPLYVPQAIFWPVINLDMIRVLMPSLIKNGNGPYLNNNNRYMFVNLKVRMETTRPQILSIFDPVGLDHVMRPKTMPLIFGPSYTTGEHMLRYQVILKLVDRNTEELRQIITGLIQHLLNDRMKCLPGYPINTTIEG